MNRWIARGLAGALVALFAGGLSACKFSADGGGGPDGGFDAIVPNGPALTALPTTQDFGTVNLGSKSATKSIVVANVGAKTTAPITANLSGSADFVIDADGCSGTSLASAGACTISVHFAPGTTGVESAQLSVAANPGGDATVSLSGTGAGMGLLVIAPTAKDLGQQVVGSTSAPFLFTAKNRGTAASGVVSLSLSGTDAEQFTISSDLCSGQVLAPNASCTLDVSASPTSPGSKVASLTARAAGDSGTATASVSATGLAGATFVVKPLAYDFGSVVLGAPAGMGQTFTVENVGGVASGTPVLAMTGPNAGDFPLTANTCAGPLAPLTASPDGGVVLSTCTFALGFAPSTAAAETATVTASAPDMKSGQATVTGTGLAPAALSISPSTQPFAALAQGAPPSSDVPFVVKNTGGVTTGNLAVTLGGTNADQFGLGTDGCTGQPLAAGLTCTVYAHFAPTIAAMAGAVQASLQVSGTPGGQTAATLTGKSLAPAQLTISPTMQPLGGILQGGIGPDYPFTVTNSGGDTSGAISVSLSGANKGDFALGTDGCSGQTLGPGAFCTVNVHFAPGVSSRGAEVATLTATASPGGSAPADLTATALAPASLTIAQPSLPEWSNEAVDTTSSTYLSLTIVNTGDQASGAITYQDTGDEFAIVQPNPCTGSLPGGQGCTFQVSYTPLTAVAPETETLTASSALGGSTQVTLEGTALWVLTVNVANETMSATGGQCGTNFVSGATVASSDGESCSIVKGASSTCKELFSDGSSVTLSEALAPGSFASFSWVGCTGAAGVPGDPCTFTMTSNMTITATFCGHAS